MGDIVLTNLVVTSAASKGEIDGVEHLVVPVVAIKEGVMNNIFYSAAEIQSFSEAWNGVPIPVNHPKTNGVDVSANTPEFEATVNIGKFYNTEYADGAIKGNIYINTEKAERLGFKGILDHFNAGNMMEVSTGLYSETKIEGGVFGNEAYAMTAANIIPNHIALLPNAIGACSIAKGCGALRANEDHPDCAECAEKDVTTMRGKFKEAIKLLGTKFGFLANEISHNDARRQIEVLLEAEHPNGDRYPWIREMYDYYCIYSANVKTYKRSYTITDDIVTLLSDAIEVTRVITYEPVGLTGNTATPLTTEVIIMNEKETKVDALIANKDTTYTAEDKAVLLTLDDKLLDKMQPVDEATEDVAADDTATATETVAANALTDTERATLTRLQAAEDAKIADDRKAIAKAHPNIDANVIAGMDAETVRAFANDIKPSADYSIGGGVGANSQGNVRKIPSIVLANADTDTGKDDVIKEVA